MRKGMTQQVFIFIFALIMMALVLTFGVRQLGIVIDTADKVETLTFIEALKKEVLTYYNFDVGSNKYLILPVPSDVNQICFFNNQLPVQGITDSVFKALLQGDKKNNVFVLPLEQFQNPGPGFFIPHLTVQGQRNPLCLTTSNSLKVLIETVALQNTVAVEVKQR